MKYIAICGTVGAGKTVVKEIYVKGRLVNLAVKG